MEDGYILETIGNCITPELNLWYSSLVVGVVSYLLIVVGDLNDYLVFTVTEIKVVVKG